MKLVVFGGFVFLGGCILLGSYSISYVIGGNTPRVSENLGSVLMAVGAIMGLIGIVSQFIKANKEK